LVRVPSGPGAANFLFSEVDFVFEGGCFVFENGGSIFCGKSFVFILTDFDGAILSSGMKICGICPTDDAEMDGWHFCGAASGTTLGRPILALALASATGPQGASREVCFGIPARMIPS
jgi:hypothetical protein